MILLLLDVSFAHLMHSGKCICTNSLDFNLHSAYFIRVNSLGPSYLNEGRQKFKHEIVHHISSQIKQLYSMIWDDVIERDCNWNLTVHPAGDREIFSHCGRAFANGRQLNMTLAGWPLDCMHGGDLCQLCYNAVIFKNTVVNNYSLVY